jgi:hypothetical protein
MIRPDGVGAALLLLLSLSLSRNCSARKWQMANGNGHDRLLHVMLSEQRLNRQNHTFALGDFSQPWISAIIPPCRPSEAYLFLIHSLRTTEAKIVGDRSRRRIHSNTIFNDTIIVAAVKIEGKQLPSFCRILNSLSGRAVIFIDSNSERVHRTIIAVGVKETKQWRSNGRQLLRMPI